MALINISQLSERSRFPVANWVSMPASWRLDEPLQPLLSSGGSLFLLELS